jgi:hypothetical protein
MGRAGVVVPLAIIVLFSVLERATLRCLGSESRRREGIINHPETPDPTQVHHGAVALTTALRILNSTDEQLRRQEGSPAQTPAMQACCTRSSRPTAGR